MIRTISVFIATSLLVVMLCDTLVLAEDTEPYKTGVRTMLVDPFKDTEQWTLKFSKFRSRYFAPAIKQEAETDIAEKQSREPNKLWYMIVDGSKYPEILPPNALPAYRDEHPYILELKQDLISLVKIGLFLNHHIQESQVNQISKSIK